MTAKYAAAASPLTQATIVASRSRVITPVRLRTTTAAAATAARPTYRVREPASSGFGTCRVSSGQVLATEGVLHQAERHADRGEAEAEVEAPLLLQQAGEQRTEQGAEVDAHVEDREAGVAALVVLVVERADERGGVGLETTAAERDQHQADPDAGETGQQGQRDVAEHHDHGAVEQRALRTDHPVGEPGAEDRGQVDGAAVRPDDPGGGGLVDAEAAVGRRVVQVDQQDPLHAVEGEPLPHLDAEQVGEDAGLSEELLLVAGLFRVRGRDSHSETCCHATAEGSNLDADVAGRHARASSLASCRRPASSCRAAGPAAPAARRRARSR